MVAGGGKSTLYLTQLNLNLAKSVRSEKTLHTVDSMKIIENC